jgi:proteasome lid subunit RPN8/RPN11
MILNDYFAEIQEAAERSDEEICGFLLYDGLGSLQVYPTKNVASSNRDERWEISGSEQLTFHKTGRVFAVYHSHVKHPCEFSPDDIRTADMAEVPMLLYSRVTRTFNYYCPVICRRPLKDRPFVFGLQDCVSLVTDYYEKEFNFKFPFFVRNQRMLDAGFPEVADYYIKQGFKPVSDLKIGDILLISVMNVGHINHVGVFLGCNMVLHQMMHRLSCTQFFDDSWSKRVRVVVRKV